MIARIGVFVLLMAAAVVLYGFVRIASRDVQGGRDEAGMVFIATGLVTALVGAALAWVGRRRAQ